MTHISIHVDGEPFEEGFLFDYGEWDIFCDPYLVKFKPAGEKILAAIAKRPKSPWVISYRAPPGYSEEETFQRWDYEILAYALKDKAFPRDFVGLYKLFRLMAVADSHGYFRCALMAWGLSIGFDWDEAVAISNNDEYDVVPFERDEDSASKWAEQRRKEYPSAVTEVFRYNGNFYGIYRD